MLISKGLPSPLPDRVAREPEGAGRRAGRVGRSGGQRPRIVRPPVRRASRSRQRRHRGGRREGSRRGEVRRVPGAAAVLRGADVALERRLLQSAVEPDDPRQAAFASGRTAVRRRHRHRRVPRRPAHPDALGRRRSGGEVHRRARLEARVSRDRGSRSTTSRHCCRTARSTRISVTPRFDLGRDTTAGHGSDAEWDRDGDMRFVAPGQRQRAPDLARPRRDLARGRDCTACRSASRPTSSAFCREHTRTGSPSCSTPPVSGTPSPKTRSRGRSGYRRFKQRRLSSRISTPSCRAATCCRKSITSWRTIPA